MCWHELQHFCCCFSVKQGVWITTFFHSLAMILILIESIHQPTYQDIKWVYEIIKILRFEPDKTHTIIITSLMGAGWKSRIFHEFHRKYIYVSVFLLQDCFATCS